MEKSMIAASRVLRRRRGVGAIAFQLHARARTSHPNSRPSPSREFLPHRLSSTLTGKQRDLYSSSLQQQSASPTFDAQGDDDRYSHTHRELTESDLRGDRPEHWYTGRAPIAGECPGVWPDGRMSSLPQLTLAGCTKRAMLDYFDNTWTLTEVLFSSLQGEEAFMRPPYHNIRHPLIFYYGHPAALYINKLRVAGLLDEPINPYYESIFETGVDEMSWDDLSKNEKEWPSVAAVHAYRKQVYETVRRVILNAPDEEISNIAFGSRYWALPMGFEHERIHVETSSVLLRELPLQFLREPKEWPACHPSVLSVTPQDSPVIGRDYPANELISVEGGQVTLGKPKDFPSYGWDNEYGSRSYDVKSFQAQKYMVSNGEFLEFVKDSGYAKAEYWTEVGWDWRSYRNMKHPSFWIPEGPSGVHRYRLRTIFSAATMPWSWPVNVNYHEAAAYAKWKSEREGEKQASGGGAEGGGGGGGKSVVYRVETELEHNMLRDKDVYGKPTMSQLGGDLGSSSSSSSGGSGAGDRWGRQVAQDADAVLATKGRMYKDMKMNLNLSYGSESPVDALPPNAKGFHDVHGNAWEWCMDKFSALHGFEITPLYEDFSTPCFDGQHNLIMGGSFASTGNEGSVFARFHFRPHFFQHSGFRCVVPGDPSSAGAYLTSCMDAPPPFVGTYPFASSDPNARMGHKQEAATMVKTALALHYGSVGMTPEQAVAAAGSPSSSSSSANGDASSSSSTSSGDGDDDDGLRALRSFVGYPRRCADMVNSYMLKEGLGGKAKVLCAGCGPGGAAFQLARVADRVLAIESNGALIQCCETLQKTGAITYSLPTEGKLEQQYSAELDTSIDRSRVTFKQADPMCLPNTCVDFDAVLIHSVLDSLPSPSGLLSRMGGACGVVRKGGYVFIMSPFDWSENETPLASWLGGYRSEAHNKDLRSVDGIARVLGDEFELVEAKDMCYTVPHSQRKYTLYVAHALVYRRKGGQPVKVVGEAA